MLIPTFINSIILIGIIVIACKIYYSFRQNRIDFISLPGIKLVTLKSRQEISHDTLLLTFSLPNSDMFLGIEVGQHIKV